MRANSGDGGGNADVGGPCDDAHNLDLPES